MSVEDFSFRLKERANHLLSLQKCSHAGMVDGIMSVSAVDWGVSDAKEIAVIPRDDGGIDVEVITKTILSYAPYSDGEIDF